MSSKKVISVLLAVFTTMLFAIPVSADVFTVPESYITEQEISVFTYGEVTDAIVTVSGEEATVTRNGHLSDMGGFIRTTLLVDISTSIPKDLRPNIIEYINSYIDDLSENEELKIVTFGETTATLTDFTSDRYDLSQVSEKIEFNGNQSHIYDTTYNTIPVLSNIDDKPCFYRTLIITDGADESAVGVTREELYIRLRDEHYPIDVIAVTANTEAEPDKNLAALTRMSGGRIYTLDPETTIDELSTETKPDDIYYISAVIPAGLTDGSVRQVSISDGSETSINFDIKIPVFKVETETTTTTTAAEITTAVTTTALTTTATVTESVTNATDTVERDKIDTKMIIIMSAAVIVIIGITAVILFAVKKKKKPENEQNIHSNTVYSRDETEIISPGIHPTIILQNHEKPEQVYNIRLQGEVIIGRSSDCQVHLDDKSVSHNQCRIYTQNDYIVIENLSRSNITKLNNTDLNSPKPLKKGDRIKCGRVVLSVESIKDSGADVGTQLLNV
jgi:hypothetical protein